MTNQKQIKLCIIRKSSIGDVILSTIVLEYLKKLNRPSTIVWIGSKPSLDLISNNYPELQCFEYNDRYSALNEIDSTYIWVDLQSTFKTLLFYIVFCISQKTLIKRYSLQKRRFYRYWIIFKNRIFGRKRKHQMRRTKSSITNDLQQLIKGIVKNSYGIKDPIKARTNLTNIPKNIEPHSALQELNYGPWICIAPGAKYQSKKVPASVISNFLKKNLSLFSEKMKPQLLFVGGKDEQELIATLCNQLEGQFNYLNLCGKLNLTQTAIAISKARLTIAADSALAHLSESLNVKTFMIYGPTAPEFGFHLHHPDNQSLSNSIGCSPCSRHGKASCRYGDFACYHQTDLSPIQETLQNMVK